MLPTMVMWSLMNRLLCMCGGDSPGKHDAPAGQLGVGAGARASGVHDPGRTRHADGCGGKLVRGGRCRGDAGVGAAASGMSVVEHRFEVERIPK